MNVEGWEVCVLIQSFVIHAVAVDALVSEHFSHQYELKPQQIYVSSQRSKLIPSPAGSMFTI